MKRHAPRPLATALASLTVRLAPRTPLAAVQSVWKDVVGEAVAAHCAPVAERGGVLQVSCDEAVWAAELELLAPELLERLAALEGGPKVTSLRCRADLSERSEFS